MESGKEEGEEEGDGGAGEFLILSRIPPFLAIDLIQHVVPHSTPCRIPPPINPINTVGIETQVYTRQSQTPTLKPTFYTNTASPPGGNCTTSLRQHAAQRSNMSMLKIATLFYEK
jgi:hypothetical protein